MPERIDGAIVLALTFILWFCVPPLIILNLMSGPLRFRFAGSTMGDQAGRPVGDEQMLRRRIPTGESALDDCAGRKRCIASAE